MLRKTINLPTWFWSIVAAIGALPLALFLSMNLGLALSYAIPGTSSFPLKQGNLPQLGFSKSGDVIFAFALMLLIFVAGICVQKLFGTEDNRTVLIVEILIFTFPAATLLVAQVFSRAEPVLPFESSPLFAVSLMQFSILTFAVLRRKLGFRFFDWKLAGLQTFLAGMLPFSVTGFMLLTAYLMPNLRDNLLNLPAFLSITTLSIVGFAISNLVAPSRLLLRTNLQSLVVTLTALASLLPPILASNLDLQTIAGVQRWAWAWILFGFGLVIVIEILLRTRRLNKQNGFVLFSSTISVFLVVLRAKFTEPTIPSDNYHFGELLSPFWLFLNGGQVPYVDIDLPRGLQVNFVPELVNNLLNDGQASTLQYVQPVLLLSVVLFAHLVFRSVFGTILATLFILPLSFQNYMIEGDLLTMAILFLIVAVSLRNIPFGIPGFVFAIGSVVAVLAYPLMGFIAFGLGGLIFTAMLIEKIRKYGNYKYVAINLASAVLIFACALLSPIGAMIIGAFNYLRGNATSNSAAYGITYVKSWVSLGGIDWILATSFTLALPISILLIRRLLSARKSAPVPISHFAFAIAPVLFAIILAGRFLGRIDPSEWSVRPTMGAIVALGIIIPAFSLLISPVRNLKIALPSVAVAIVLSIALDPTFVAPNTSSAMGMLPSPDTSISSTLSAEIPLLGEGKMEVSEANYLASLEHDGPIISSGEYVLNLSNNGTLFAYFGWKNPVKQLAPYNMESTSSELEAISRVETFAPTFALIGPGPRHDGGSLAQRTPTLTSWLMDNYTPFLCGPNTWALKTDFNAEKAVKLVPDTCKIPSNEFESQLLWQDAIGNQEDMGKSLAFWGETLPEGKLSSARQLMELENLLWKMGSPVSVDDTVILNSKCLSGAPKSALGLHPDTMGTARFFSGTKQIAEVSFTFGEGIFALPLSGFPILKGAVDTTLQLDITSGNCSQWKISSALVQR